MNFANYIKAHMKVHLRLHLRVHLRFLFCGVLLQFVGIALFGARINAQRCIIIVALEGIIVALKGPP